VLLSTFVREQFLRDDWDPDCLLYLVLRGQFLEVRPGYCLDWPASLVGRRLQQGIARVAV
jgi:hypothetical protein